VRLDIVVVRVECRNTAALGTSMVDQLLEQLLDVLARKATSVLEESTESGLVDSLPASDVLAVIVPFVVVQAQGGAEEASQLETDVGAVAAAVAVDALSRDTKSKGGRSEESGEMHSEPELLLGGSSSV
jgi:hypothetical protein